MINSKGRTTAPVNIFSPFGKRKAPSQEFFVPPEEDTSSEGEGSAESDPSSGQSPDEYQPQHRSAYHEPLSPSTDTESSFSPNNMFGETPFIPTTLIPLRAYRYRAARDAWKHIQTYSGEEIRDMLDDPDASYPTGVRIITWNIDMQSPNLVERLHAVLRHLEREVLLCADSQAPFEPCIICLQEVHQDVIPELLADEWVKRNFAITPISSSKWPMSSPYGNVTLVSKDLPLVKAEILHYGNSRMARTALAVYVMLSEPEPSAENAVICIVNTHLESLKIGSTSRPKQMELAARFLKQVEVRGGVVVGDMNPVGPQDEDLPLSVGLRDTWRRGSDASGHTWGYQGNQGFPPARFDKILYLPRRGYKMDPPEIIGKGVRTLEGQWASDHYGLESMLRLVTRRNST